MGLRLLRDESMKHQSATQAINCAYPSFQHHHIFKHCSSCGAHRGRSLAAARPACVCALPPPSRYMDGWSLEQGDVRGVDDVFE